MAYDENEVTIEQLREENSTLKKRVEELEQDRSTYIKKWKTALDCAEKAEGNLKIYHEKWEYLEGKLRKAEAVLDTIKKEK